MTALLPTMWTMGACAGKPDGHVRMWTKDDAARLAHEGVPVRLNDPAVARRVSCPPCQQVKVVTTAAAGTWCFACWLRAESAQSMGRAA